MFNHHDITRNAFIGCEYGDYVMVQAAELSVPAILEALRAGRFYATQGPEFHSISIEDGLITVQTSPVSRITFCSNLYWVDDRCRSGQSLTGEVYRIHPNEHFVRIQLTDADGKKTWSSPIKTRPERRIK